MKKYIIIREQEGGCDYTIGCGIAYEVIGLSDNKSIDNYILEDIVDNYGDAGCAIRDLEERGIEYSVFEIQDIKFSFDEILAKLKKQSDSEKEAETLAVDEIEFERLKKKLGK